MNTENDWCRALKITPPVLEAVMTHREANTYSMLIVALLEHGEPLTLSEVACRFEVAGIADRQRALASLSRCKPARAPIYRDGEHYHLDPYDDELDLWAFRLGLRPARVPSLQVVKPAPEALPPPDVALSVEELTEAWKDISLGSWSEQRLALAVLDAHGKPMNPAEVLAFVATRNRWHRLSETPVQFGRRGCPIIVLDDGRWAIAEGSQDAIETTREAVRARIDVSRRNQSTRTNPAVAAALTKAFERKRAEHGAQLTNMSRALLAAYPENAPRAIALIDVGRHTIETYVDGQIAGIPERLTAFECIGAIEVRSLLRALRFEPGERHLAELGPSQKSKALNRSGRSLKITTAMLVTGSCGISKPFGDPEKIKSYLINGQLGKLRARLEADAKSLLALYEYGRLHGTVRLRWGFLDEHIPAPWSHPDEPRLYRLKDTALKEQCPLEVVVGNAPGWQDPWSRAQRAVVVGDATGWHTSLVNSEGVPIVDEDVQLARLVR